MDKGGDYSIMNQDKVLELSKCLLIVLALVVLAFWVGKLIGTLF